MCLQWRAGDDGVVVLFAAGTGAGNAAGAAGDEAGTMKQVLTMAQEVRFAAMKSVEEVAGRVGAMGGGS